MASALVTDSSQTHCCQQPISCWVHRSQLIKENDQPSKAAAKELTGMRDLQANICQCKACKVEMPTNANSRSLLMLTRNALKCCTKENNAVLCHVPVQQLNMLANANSRSLLMLTRNACQCGIAKKCCTGPVRQPHLLLYAAPPFSFRESVIRSTGSHLGYLPCY